MAWYKTGTVAVTNASTTVTGTGTNFVSGAQVGDGFLGPNELLYEITAINSATSLTIAPAYNGATASSQNYAIAPTQGLVATLASDVTDLITDYQSVVDNAGAGKFGDGSAASPAIRFTNDQDTGFFRDTANEIAFATAGVKRGEFRSSGIQLLDGQKFIAGTGNDLQIYHDGTHSRIDDTGTGKLILRGNDAVEIHKYTGEYMITAAADGAVTLYHDDSPKLATTSTGVDISGTLTSDSGRFDNSAATPVRLHINNSGSNDYASIYADTTSAYKNLVLNPNGGNVGIGTDSPTDKLNISSGSNQIGLDTGNQATYGTLDLGHFTNGAFISTQAGTNAASNLLRFGTSGSEAMRIDSSGNLLVGKTTTAFGTVGSYITSSGSLGITRSNNNPIDLNRLSSDGVLINFHKDGSTVGSIGVTNSLGVRKPYLLGAGGNGITLGNNSLLPADTSGDAAASSNNDLGAASFQWRDLHLSGGVVFGDAGGSGTSTSNTLDSYEEGTWTPDVRGGGSNPTVSYSSQTGYYTKIGNLVHINFFVALSSISGGSGQIEIHGLPFNQSNQATHYSTNPAEVEGVANNQDMFMRINNGTSYAVLGYRTSGSTYNSVLITSFSNNDYILAQATYKTA